LQILLEAGADVNITDDYGCSAVWIAASEGHTECLKLLIKSKQSLSFSHFKRKTV
jgi:ankyrin repeat protein